MSVLIYIESRDGAFKKNYLETICYGVAVAQKLGVAAEVIAEGTSGSDLSELGRYGITKIYKVDSAEPLSQAQIIKTIENAVKNTAAEILIFSQNATSKAIAGELAATLEAGIVTGVVALPDTENGFVAKKAIYAGKAFAYVKINSPVKIITVNPNVYKLVEAPVQATVEELPPGDAPSRIKVTDRVKNTAAVPLNEAEKVVAGGMGLKGSENWQIVTDLADALGAAAACSRPVSDSGWRPHQEHVGQTGMQIAPALYVAVGISGAIQHLGGVNRSKFIVAINKDPEASIFKVADFGMVGDLFEIVPKLTEAIKKAKS